MLSPRRTAQLGILSATLVLLTSLCVLIMQGADNTGSRVTGSASVNPSPAQTPMELSVSSQPHTPARH